MLESVFNHGSSGSFDGLVLRHVLCCFFVFVIIHLVNKPTWELFKAVSENFTNLRGLVQNSTFVYVHG